MTIVLRMVFITMAIAFMMSGGPEQRDNGGPLLVKVAAKPSKYVLVECVPGELFQMPKGCIRRT